MYKIIDKTMGWSAKKAMSVTSRENRSSISRIEVGDTLIIF
jgi:hypothetical protein